MPKKKYYSSNNYYFHNSHRGVAVYQRLGLPSQPVLLTTIGRNFRNMAEILRNVGGTSGAEQLDP